MKKVIAVVLSLTTLFCLVGCNNKIKDNTNASSEFEATYSETDVNSAKADASSSENSKNQSSVKPSSADGFQENNKSNATDNDISSFVTTEKVKINSLDKLNYYAVKGAIAENGVTLLSASAQKPKITALADITDFRMLKLANSTAVDINPDSVFTITMYSYFTVTLNDSRGFLAQKLGGTGAAEVVITRNNFNNMITFKKGERYYSCFQTSSTDKAMSFSSHKYVSGYKLVENYDGENYEFTVYFEGDKVIGINCGRFKEGDSFKYVADDIKFNDNFSFVIHKKQSFTAEQLEGLFASNNSFVDDGVVLDDGTVLFGESSVTDNTVAFKNASGTAVITNNHIKKVSAMHNGKFGFCIRLELASEINVTDKTNLSFYLNNSKDRELTLQKDGTAVYITNLDNKSRMSDVFYKLTAINTSNRIGRIIDHNDFVREISKRLKLNDYNVSKDNHSDSTDNGLKMVDYNYDLKTDKSISYKASNYEITIDGITVTMPIKVSDLLSRGFTVTEKHCDESILQGSATFRTPSNNEFVGVVRNLYGSSTNFNDCYFTQIRFLCYEYSGGYQEGINPTRPDFEMLEGINKDSTLDEIISRLGEPNNIILMTTDNQSTNHKDCVIYLCYKVSTPSLPNGKVTFTLYPVLNGEAPSDFLTVISFALQ